MKMKTGLKGVMLGALLFAGSIAASADSKIVVLPYHNTSYTLVAAEVLDSNVRSLAIVDDMGETVYVSRPDAMAGRYSKVFDFSRLTDGTYRVRLRSKAGVVSELPFAVKNGTVDVAKSEMVPASENELKVWNNEDYLFVSHLNRALSPAVITLEDSYGRVLYNQNLPANLTYSGKYNVEALPRGEYKVNIVSGSKEFSYAFRK
ncbi:hypothetical protein [Geofilum rhodophaeum]|uniref:hypothetical protein n=1 Tax=Geofilum rhodophaeum TaxID=1965019 RepID=UPI000B5244B3|nr:hypothetical protein [Geofilum rhodophaeum]